jgi:hypothetical protein
MIFGVFNSLEIVLDSLTPSVAVRKTVWVQGTGRAFSERPHGGSRAQHDAHPTPSRV